MHDHTTRGRRPKPREVPNCRPTPARGGPQHRSVFGSRCLTHRPHRPTNRPTRGTESFPVILARSAAEPANANNHHADDSTLAQCLASAKVLGEEMSEAAARFLTWQIPRLEDCSERLLFALGLLIFATRLRSRRIPDPVLGNVAEWVLAEESLYRQAFPSDPPDSMPIAFSIQSGFWQPLAEELKREAETICTDDVRTNLQLCELLLDTG
jgi:hypothetical protein